MDAPQPLPASQLQALRADLRRRTAGFDPSRLPLLPPQAGQLSVPPERLQTGALRQHFAQHPHWQPTEIIERPWVQQDLTPSAVLLAIVARPQLQVLLTQRASGLSNHSGQIAFAGGRMDASDANAAACALREAEEEIGLPPAQVEVIGQLPNYTTGTAYDITPVVALVQPDYQLRLNPAEVDSAFEIPLAHLLDPQQHHRQEVENLGLLRRWYAMPSHDQHGQPRFVWGASAGILRHLYSFLLA